MTSAHPLSLTPQLSELDKLLPAAPQPIGSYVPVIQVGNLVMTSGMLPMQDGQLMYTGAIGSISHPVEFGQKAARLCALNALSAIKAYLGSLDRIQRMVKVTGYINSVPDFFEQPQVLNGASDLLVEFFGEAGKHVRAAVGVTSLPRNASVEVELLVELNA